MQILLTQKSILVPLATTAAIAVIVIGVLTGRMHARDEGARPLVVRVAVFSADQGRLDDYRNFINRHLFPALRTVPGYVGTFLGRHPDDGHMVSLSFWRSEADAVAGEEAVGRAIRALPPGSAPKPSTVGKYVIEYSDLAASFSK